MCFELPFSFSLSPTACEHNSDTVGLYHPPLTLTTSAAAAVRPREHSGLRKLLCERHLQALHTGAERMMMVMMMIMMAMMMAY